MSAREFFLDGREDELLSCTRSLAALGAAADDVLPLASSFDVREVPDNAVDPVIWLGSGGAVTHAHYDGSHNVFVQLFGRKTLWLWPPSAHAALRLYPTVHSMHRQSLLPWPPTAGEPVELTLRPGQAAYIPPFWFHQMRSIDARSASLAFWSRSLEDERKDALERMPLPWESEWSAVRRSLAATQLARQLLAAVHGSEGAGAAALRRQLGSRFASLAALGADDQEGLLADAPELPELRHCSPRAELSQARAEVHALVARAVAPMATAVANVSSDLAVREIVLGDYLEAVARFVLSSGTQQPGRLVHAFLACCLGSWDGREGSILGP